MILGLGGGWSPFLGPPNSGKHSSRNWFPLSNGGPTPAHLFSLRPRFLLTSSSKGTLSRGGWNLKQFNFCFFDENSSGYDTHKEVSAPSQTPRRNSFFKGHWTNALLAANVLLYVAQMATQGRLMFWGAKINSLIDEGQLWRLLTSAFLHANIGHLLVNCYSLHSVGPTVEKICGTRRFFTIYFVSAITSSALSYWLSEAPAVGASGAIFGLVGSVAVFSLRHRSIIGSGTQDLKHIAQVIVLNMIIGLSSSGIDNWGHLGGLLGGAAVSWLIGPAWTYDSTTKDGRRVFIDRAPIYFLNQKKQ